ncbi:MAG: hypothetical protein CSA68_08085 [Rhodobacterales bacterium]|nr:MAG: hypothetical protein CSA68_08085 [Rhodobacterales bacterium]
MKIFSGISQKTTALGGIALILTACLASSASANKQLCTNYAQEAVNMFHKAKALSCGFKPPVWSGNFKSHYDWCMAGNNASQAKKHTAHRLAQFKSCKASKGKLSQTDECRLYALEAVQDNQEAQKLGCGFKPPVWSNNHQNHYNWCMGGTKLATVHKEAAKRKTALMQCRAQKNKPAELPLGKNKKVACDLYANEALKVAAKASARGCGFSGPRWVQSYQVHYQFCLKDPNPVILLAEAAARSQEYKACISKASTSGGAGTGGVAIWVFADSNKRRLTDADLAPLSPAQLWQARNEIVARKGYIFKTAKARKFFAKMPWYQPVSKTVTINKIEQANIALIKSYE